MVSNDLRNRIVESYIHGNKQKEISKMFGIPISTPYSIINLHTKESRMESKLKGGPRNKALSGEHIESLKRGIKEDSSITLQSLKQMLGQRQ